MPNLGNGTGHYAFRRSRVVEIESEWTARHQEFKMFGGWPGAPLIRGFRMSGKVE